MHEYYFANYRLLVDDAINNSEKMKHLVNFSKEMPATHTFTLRMGDEELFDQLFTKTSQYPIVCTIEGYNIHDTQDSWVFVSSTNKTNRK